jgi:hypothetical protein
MIALLGQEIMPLFIHSDGTPNAGGEPRPMAGATQERTLLGVGSSAWLGVMVVRERRWSLDSPFVQPVDVRRDSVRIREEGCAIDACAT